MEIREIGGQDAQTKLLGEDRGEWPLGEFGRPLLGSIPTTKNLGLYDKLKMSWKVQNLSQDEWHDEKPPSRRSSYIDRR